MTKNEILASILPLASKEGLRNLSLSKIAENAGIAKSTLYSHFDSKDDMIDQLYLYLREKAKERMHIGVVDYGNIVKGKSLEEVLLYNRDSDMKNFYAIIESEKAFSNIAARIITEETETMFTATKNLFYALEAEKIAHFPSIENAALLFAQSIHSTLTLMQDDETAGTEVSKGILEKIIHEFSNLYRIKKE